MAKNKLHTFINIGGMTVAFACSIIILLLEYNHFTYDNFHKNGNSLYKIYSYGIGPNGDKVSTAMPYPLTAALKSENIGIIRATSVEQRGKLIRTGDKTLDMGCTLVDADFFNMFSFPVLKGYASAPLSSLSDAVLTETSAKKLFGNADPIGKQVEVKLGGKWTSLRVSAVAKDPPLNSTIKFSLLARIEIDPDYASNRNNWDNQNHPVFVQIATNTTQHQVEQRLRSFTKKYRPVDLAAARHDGDVADENGDYNSFRLASLKGLHFNNEAGDGNSASKDALYTLMLIGCVIILIASFNFVNLNIGLSFTRSKEIGIRKCLGAEKKQIWFQVWGESFLMVLFSMIVAIAVADVLAANFNQVFGNKMNTSLLHDPVVVAILLLLVLIVSFIASGYPSAVMARLKTTEILKGKITIKKRGGLRNALIVTQFVIAIVLICSTIIIFQQFDHLRTAPLGYNTSSIISIPIKNDEKGEAIASQMRTRLASDPSVVSVSGSSTNLGIGEDHSTSAIATCFTIGEKSICGQMLSADYDFLKTLGIKPTEGGDFLTTYANDTLRRVIVSQSYAAQFGEKNIVGYSYYSDSSEPKMNIVGVIPDFQLMKLGSKQQPLFIELNRSPYLNYILVKVNTTNPLVTMNKLKSVYASLEPGVEFNGSYVDDNIQRWFADEQNMARLFSIAAAIAIALSCMGLFGIASIVIRQRVKEIGVRKVLGAPVGSIISLVSREFLKPVFIAFLIAVPIGWWAMHRWLESYAYRVTIHWWVFVLTGFVAVAITILTVGFQSIKAAIANPVKSLRTE